jgi:hypothetical protein
MPHTEYSRLHNQARALESVLRAEWRLPARLPIGLVLGVDAHSDKAERPSLAAEAFTAPRSTATGYEDGCFTECA